MVRQVVFVKSYDMVVDALVTHSIRKRFTDLVVENSISLFARCFVGLFLSLVGVSRHVFSHKFILNLIARDSS